MQKTLLICGLLLLFLFPSVGKAQETTLFSSVAVDIWPEYDQVAVLVIERITLSSESSLPASVTISIPSDSQINAVAVIDSTGQLINTPYESTLQGQWSVLKITSNSLNLQLEYYQPLVKDGFLRHITYKWLAGNPVEKLVMNFLAPADAENIKLDPVSTSNAPGESGLQNYLVETGNILSGQTFTLKIDYQRQSNELRITGLPVQAVTEPGATTAGLISMTSYWAWILGGAGLLLVAASILGFLRWKRAGQASEAVGNGEINKKSEKTELIYCHECGKRAQPGDIFCRTCGTRLKQDQKI
jgi:hypothetical protein